MRSITGALRSVGASTEERPPIARASSTDLAFLAMDTDRVPEQIAVILMVEPPGDLNLHQLRQLIADRIRALPRLRQRLIKAPPGCGRPVWVDDLDFDIDRHVRAVSCQGPGDKEALFATALSVIMTPLPREHPLWSMLLITDLMDGAAAVVVVLHHVIADGVGGLNVLAALLDPGAPPAAESFPRPWPSRANLARDAWQSRLRSIRRVAVGWRTLRDGTFAGGGLHPPRATPCSLVRRTGPHRRMAVVRLERARLAAASHRHGATTNDAVLVAVAAALQEVLLSRGESVDPIVITVPVSGRRQNGGLAVGNLVGPMLVRVPTSGGMAERLTQVAAAVRGHKAAATGPPPIAVLGGLFRLLARLGGFRLYMNHQHRFHTLVTHVRGPAEPVSLSGHRISAATPVSVADGGNLTVYFEVLSYAGVLTIAAFVDPEQGPDLDEVTRNLRRELDSIMTTDG